MGEVFLLTFPFIEQAISHVIACGQTVSYRRVRFGVRLIGCEDPHRRPAPKVVHPQMAPERLSGLFQCSGKRTPVAVDSVSQQVVR